MLFVKAQPVTNVVELRVALQNAIELEHATIPPYLTAYYSLKQGTNQQIATLLRSIIVEEMQHMTLAANILNAVGGHPDINKPGFVPKYPGPLPMGIGDKSGKEFIVPLKRFSLPLVEQIFMTIEGPETPLHFQTMKVALTAELAPQYQTIGQFYTAIGDLIVREGNPIFSKDPKQQARQVTGVFGLPDSVLKITDVDSAMRAIDRIITQGEGTTTSPEDGQKELAHYYRFEEISRGQRLVQDKPGSPWLWDPKKHITFEPSGVWPMMDNPSLAAYPKDSQAYRLALEFNSGYSNLLNALHVAFNGHPRKVDDAIGLMYSLTVQASSMAQVPVPGTDFTAAPTYELSPP
jgi:hypothetical protein